MSSRLNSPNLRLTGVACLIMISKLERILSSECSHRDEAIKEALSRFYMFNIYILGSYEREAA